MEEKKLQKFRQRLEEENQKMIRSISRNRQAEEEIQVENTDDEGDLATISRALVNKVVFRGRFIGSPQSVIGTRR